LDEELLALVSGSGGQRERRVPSSSRIPPSRTEDEISSTAMGQLREMLLAELDKRQ